MLDHLNELLGSSPLNNLHIIGPDHAGQAGLTMPPNSIGRPVKPTAVPPQPTDQAPTVKK